ncbi:MAG: hypothetical protein ABFE13_10995 [Phycisphaerales bacterium]
MRECCRKSQHKEATLQVRDKTLRGLTIEPPPKEQGPQQLYRVVYTIDVDAMHAKQAAERAHEIMKDPQSMPPILDVIDSEGRLTRIDLSEE